MWTFSRACIPQPLGRPANSSVLHSKKTRASSFCSSVIEATAALKRDNHVVSTVQDVKKRELVEQGHLVPDILANVAVFIVV